MAASPDRLEKDWKDEYFRAVNDYESQLADQASRLRRLERELCAVFEDFEGRDPGFDADLDELRTQLQSDSDGASAVMRTLLAQIETLIESGASSAVEAPANTVDAMRATLECVFDGLSLPEKAAKDIQALRGELEQACDEAALKAIAGRLVDSVVGCAVELHSEITALRRFLCQVKTRLGELSGHVADDTAARRMATRDRDQFDSDMRTGLASLHDRSQDATDLATLKTSIGEQINHLHGRVGQYIETESARANAAEQRSEQLATQLRRLDAESDRLREALVNAQAQATRDALTGLPNRLAYEERLALESARARRSELPLTLAIVDLDRFKQINDGYGHQAGDRVLKHFATLLRNEVRAQDFVARFGGEEFVLLLPETALDDALGVVDGLRQCVSNCQFRFRDAPLNVTISCGVTEIGPEEPLDVSFARADSALYKAKADGRNRCVANAT